MSLVLWRNRWRPPPYTLKWAATWAKRMLLARHFVTQWFAHRRLRRAGATIASSAFVADASMISGADLRSLSIGEESFVGRVEIAAHAPVSIGRCVCLNDGVKLLTASHDISDPSWRTVAKPIIIMDHAWLATNAIVLPGVTIGRGAVVGAAAVVTRDVPDHAVVAGNPATILAKSRTTCLQYSPVRFIALYEAWLGRPDAETS